ncbi:ABC transporter transmembrane protein [Rhodococcus sp. RD6.2]|uniref:FtsX-like permease family protein n=1 Tax=Rhodococcus sp. RD6.2 TaxID=260936 RepID=UPI00063B934D|nr:ABC transporter permease [Rhodococcus sp. RD6.2]CRK51415.1 ABC transporter transmembrane protein [Rhodococcus sp. RD6.2]
MLRLTLAQARANAARYVASGSAILIAVAFVVATLVLGSTTSASVTNSLAGQYRTSAVVVDGLADAGQAAETAERVAAVPGVRAVTVDGQAPVKVAAAGHGKLFGTVTSLAEAPDLRWQRLAEGRFPAASGEIAVGSDSGLSLGDTVAVTVRGARADEGTEAGTGTATVVGEIDLAGSAERLGGVAVYTTADQLRAWSGDVATHEIRASGDGDPRELRDSVAAALGPDVVVRTGAEQAQAASASYLGDTDTIRNVLLAFAAVAVVVAGLVIANTFAVLLAARTRELALLRCVGATARQIRRSTRIEAVAVGVAASAAGVLAGIGLAWAVTRAAIAFDAPVPLDTLAVTPTAVLAGLAVGIIVTYLAAVAPARAATRVSPLAALAPVEAAAEPATTSRARLFAGLAGLVAGAGVLGFGVYAEQVMIACAGGIVTALGVVVLGRTIVPPMVAAVGRVPARLVGPLGELAVGNALRNPRRTTATATALLVGVTVTATMVVGIATVGAAAPRALDEQFPVDVSVDADVAGGLPANLEPRIRDIDLVTAAAPLLGADVVAGDGTRLAVLGVDRVDSGATLRIPLALPAAGEISLSPEQARVLGTAAGDTLDVENAGVRRSLSVVTGQEGQPALVDRVDALALAAVPQSLWIRLADGLSDRDLVAAQNEITSVAEEFAPTAEVGGAVSMRAAIDSVLDVLLVVVIGLLSVAVLIALIGVGNTMALSVIERRRESGLLRSLGVTRSGLRSVLICEAVLVAVVASALGVVLGSVLGVAGTASVFGLDSLDPGSVPWLQLALIVLVGGVAGVIAAAAPARSAARATPVEALAV